MKDSSQPLVSIGLPTFNRAKMIGHAINSALNQDYPNIELVISDNASTDETASVCKMWSERDPRVRYLQQSANRGATENFNIVLEEAQGEFFVWLGDDDWFDSNYISSCVNELMKNADYVLVYSNAIYYQEEKVLHERKGFDLKQKDAYQRIKRYFQQVDDNAMFYGVMRIGNLRNAPRLKHEFGGDWILMASICCSGKISVLQETNLHRSLGGASAGLEILMKSMQLKGMQLLFPYACFAWNVGKTILSRSFCRNEIKGFRRILLAIECQIPIYKLQWRIQLSAIIFYLLGNKKTRPIYLFLRQMARVGWATFGTTRK